MNNLISSSFTGLELEPVQHKYTLDGESITAVSDVVKNYIEPFDFENKSKEYAEKYNLDVEEVRKRWKDCADNACDFGHSVHKFGEMYFMNNTLSPRNNHEFALTRFWKSLPAHICPIICEARVYTKSRVYAGTFDLLLYNQKVGGAIIVDYKTNKDLFKNFKGKRMLSPFDFLLDNPFNHYQLQLSLYQIPLEEIGVGIIDRWVVWLKSDGDYSVLSTIDYTEQLKYSLTLN